MSLSQGVPAEVLGTPAIRAADIQRGGARWYTIHVLTGSVVALGYLAATGASVDALVKAFAVATVGLAVVWPAAGLAALALILPMHKTDLFQPVYMDAMVLGATGLGCLMIRRPGGGPPGRIHPGLVLAAGYAMYCALGVLPMVSGHPPDWAPSAGLQAIRILSAVGIFMVASYLFRWIPPMMIIAVALIGGFLAAVLALLAFWHLGPLGLLAGLLAPSDPASPLLPALQADRASGGFSNANYLGFFAAQYGLLALGVWPLASARYRPMLAIALAAIVTTLVVSFSRSSYIGMAAGVIILTWARSPRTAIVLVIIVIAAVAVLYPAFLEARLNGGDAFDPWTIFQRAQSENGRRLAAAAGVSMFLIEPIFGVGFGVFQHISPAYIGGSRATASHNVYAQVLGEQGLIGIVMVIGILVALVTALMRSQNPLRATALAMLCAYIIQSVFINSTQSIQISGLIWLTMAAALSAADRLPSAGTEET